jgi:CheY-like chemotaxis protein
MSENALKIFVVDDAASARMIAAHVASGLGHVVSEFADGQACLDALDSEPDIILLDVEMPGINGIGVCQACRERGLTQAQVIFLSGHDDLDTRMAAYDAGGNDYVVKPYAAAELARKIKVAERALETTRGLTAQASFARQTAFTAMSSMGEMGAVLEFLRASFACATPAELARALFAAFAQYGLHGMAEIRLADGPRCYSSNRELCTELEASIVGHARNMGRLFQFSDRLAINSPHLTLLAMDLPVDDPERAGRFRDHLALLSEGAEARLKAMKNERHRAAHIESMASLISGLGEVLSDIERQQGELRVGILDAASRYAYELHAAYGQMALTAEQETALSGIARAGHERISSLLRSDSSAGGRLRQVIAYLQRSLHEEDGAAADSK